MRFRTVLKQKKSVQTPKQAQVNIQAYEVLEPNSWLGKELPIIDYIDINDKLKTGNWLVLFYHYDCPDCINAIEKLNETKSQIPNAKYNIAIIEVPPYGSPIETNCTYGRLFDVKEWFITTPAVVLLKGGEVTQTWEQKLPDFGSVLDNIFAETRGNPLPVKRR